METLEDVLADELGQAAVLRHNKHTHDADLIERVVGRVRASAEDYILWLSEGAAQMRSGKSRTWLRSHFAEWCSQGHARMNGRHREYRQLIVPQRVHVSAEAEAGRLAGEAARRIG